MPPSSKDPEEKFHPLTKSRLQLIQATRKLLNSLADQDATMEAETLIVGKEKEEVLAWRLSEINRELYYVTHAADSYGEPRFITKLNWWHPLRWCHHSKMDPVVVDTLYDAVKKFLDDLERSTDEASDNAPTTVG